MIQLAFLSSFDYIGRTLKHNCQKFWHQKPQSLKWINPASQIFDGIRKRSRFVKFLIFLIIQTPDFKHDLPLRMSALKPETNQTKEVSEPGS
jgi:hypothetical protein